MVPDLAIWLTPLHHAEIIHAMYAHVFWKKASLIEVERANANFQQSVASGIFRLTELPAKSFVRCMDLARSYGPSLGVRTLDSLHVASAVELGAEKFWTFDERQARLAEAVGLDARA